MKMPIRSFRGCYAPASTRTLKAKMQTSAHLAIAFAPNSLATEKFRRFLVLDVDGRRISGFDGGGRRSRASTVPEYHLPADVLVLPRSSCDGGVCTNCRDFFGRRNSLEKQRHRTSLGRTSTHALGALWFERRKQNAPAPIAYMFTRTQDTNTQISA